jgi:hypothetical protein
MGFDHSRPASPRTISVWRRRTTPRASSTRSAQYSTFVLLGCDVAGDMTARRMSSDRRTCDGDDLVIAALRKRLHAERGLRETARPEPPSGRPSNRPPARSKAEASWLSCLTRATPSLPDPATGLTTHGKPCSPTNVLKASRSATTAEAVESIPVSRSLTRIACLSCTSSTVRGECVAIPSASPITAQRSWSLSPKVAIRVNGCSPWAALASATHSSSGRRVAPR